MREIVERLFEFHRIDEVRKSKALDSIVQKLESRLSQISHYSHHDLAIVPNTEDACVDIIFTGTDDVFKVYPRKSKISNENSNRVIKVSDIDGAYIKGTQVYDSEGNLLGEALIRSKATHNKSDYSDKLEDAQFTFNSKITDLRKLEKYIASESINNMK